MALNFGMYFILICCDGNARLTRIVHGIQARHRRERDMPESVAAKVDSWGAPGGSPDSPPGRRSTSRATIHVITRCRRGRANILITAQYINY